MTGDKAGDVNSEQGEVNRDQIPLHTMLGLTYVAPEAGAQSAEVSMPVRPEAFGFTSNLHGGAIATLVDVACALCAARASDFDIEAESLVTADMHIRYLTRPQTDTVVAKADVVRVGSQLIVIDAKVSDTNGRVIASADVSLMRVPFRP